MGEKNLKIDLCHRGALGVYYAQKMNDAYEFGTVDPTNLLLPFLNPADLDADAALDYVDSGALDNTDPEEVLDERFILVPGENCEMDDDKIINVSLLRFQPVIAVGAMAAAGQTVTVTDVQVDIGTITDAGVATILATAAMTRNWVVANSAAYDRHSRSRIIIPTAVVRTLMATSERVYMDVRIIALVSGGNTSHVRILCGRGQAETYLIIPLL
jgi:hypothetical protein